MENLNIRQQMATGLIVGSCLGLLVVLGFPSLIYRDAAGQLLNFCRPGFHCQIVTSCQTEKGSARQDAGFVTATDIVSISVDPNGHVALAGKGVIAGDRDSGESFFACPKAQPGVKEKCLATAVYTNAPAAVRNHQSSRRQALLEQPCMGRAIGESQFAEQLAKARAAMARGSLTDPKQEFKTVIAGDGQTYQVVINLLEQNAAQAGSRS